MEIAINGSPKEIAELVLSLQNRQAIYNITSPTFEGNIETLAKELAELAEKEKQL